MESVVAEYRPEVLCTRSVQKAPRADILPLLFKIALSNRVGGLYGRSHETEYRPNTVSRPVRSIRTPPENGTEFSD